MRDGRVKDKYKGVFAEPIPKIAVGEAIAIEKAIEIAAEAALLIVATDNVEAGRSFANGWATDPEVDHIVARAVFQGKLVIADTPTAENAADVDTRPDVVFAAEEVERRVRKSWERLEKAIVFFGKRNEGFCPRERGEIDEDMQWEDGCDLDVDDNEVE
jgi:hypothetical protein